MLFRLYCYRTFVFPEGQEEIVIPAAASAPLFPAEAQHNAAPYGATHLQHHQRPVPETATR
jgi:hypothetical protein